METVWDFLTFLWSAAMNFLGTRIEIMGLNFTLWEFALGSTILIIILNVVFNPNE